MAPVAFSLADQTLDNTLGVALLGVIGAAILFGITTLQSYCYYHSYPEDSPLHKCSIALLWVLNALHLALTIHTVYHYTVTGFGNVATMTYITWSLKLQVSINVVVILIVHSLYALRVWRLGDFHGGFLGYFVSTVVAGGFAIGIVLAYSIYTIERYTDLDRISWVVTAALATSTSIDFVIAAAMCYYLRKSKGGITRLNSMISTVMQYTLSSGLFTSACSLSALFCYLLLPNTFVFLALEFLLTNFYIVSFLTMLNARERKASADMFDHNPTQMSISWQSIKMQTATSSFWSPRPQSTQLSAPSIYTQTIPGTISHAPTSHQHW